MSMPASRPATSAPSFATMVIRLPEDESSNPRPEGWGVASLASEFLESAHDCPR